MSSRTPATAAGLHLAPGVAAAHRFRVREAFLRDHAVPMMARNQTAALKVQLLLLACGRIPAHLGKRPMESVGTTYTRMTYPEIYGLVGPGALQDREEQRAWVRRQVVTLEDRTLAERYDHPTRGLDVRALCDRGTGAPLDDPDGDRGSENTYVTLNSTVIAAGFLAAWGAPELSFYLAAMVGEAHDRKPPAMANRGDGSWWRSDDWFADTDGSRRPLEHIRVPFSKSTLKRGRRELTAADLVQVTQLDRNPDSGRTFARGGHRNYYLNRFETQATEVLADQGRPVAQLVVVDMRT